MSMLLFSLMLMLRRVLLLPLLHDLEMYPGFRRW